jgi:hypothetical protein
MKGKQRTPLWLICDVAPCLRLHVALGILALAVRRFLPRHSCRPPSEEGVVWLTAWLSGCETLLRWVIARQAFRLCGLDPRRCRPHPVRGAANSRVWYARLHVMLHMYDSMTVLARRWAKRIRARDVDFRIRNPDLPNPANFHNPTPSSPDPSNFRITGFRVTIRGPPACSGYRLPTADCFAARASEAAGVCAGAILCPRTGSCPASAPA